MFELRGEHFETSYDPQTVPTCSTHVLKRLQYQNQPYTNSKTVFSTVFNVGGRLWAAVRDVIWIPTFGKRSFFGSRWLVCILTFGKIGGRWSEAEPSGDLDKRENEYQPSGSKEAERAKRRDPYAFPFLVCISYSW